MNQATTDRDAEHKEYDFDELDFRYDDEPRSASRGEPDSTMMDEQGSTSDEPAPSQIDSHDSRPQRNSRPERPGPSPVAKPASKRKYWIWTGVGVGFLIVFGGISYWALSVGSTQGTSIRPGQPTLQMQGSVIDAPALSPSKKVAQSTATETPPITETPVTVAKVREATPQPAAVPAGSESDEAYYDRMALEAGKESSSIPVIPEPTPAPVHVVEPRVEDNRIVTSEQSTSATAEMRKNSSEMSELLGL